MSKQQDSTPYLYPDGFRGTINQVLSGKCNGYIDKLSDQTKRRLANNLFTFYSNVLNETVLSRGQITMERIMPHINVLLATRIVESVCKNAQDTVAGLLGEFNIVRDSSESVNSLITPYEYRIIPAAQATALGQSPPEPRVITGKRVLRTSRPNCVQYRVSKSLLYALKALFPTLNSLSGRVLSMEWTDKLTNGEKEAMNTFTKENLKMQTMVELSLIKGGVAALLTNTIENAVNMHCLPDASGSSNVNSVQMAKLYTDRLRMHTCALNRERSCLKGIDWFLSDVNASFTTYCDNGLSQQKLLPEFEDPNKTPAGVVLLTPALKRFLVNAGKISPPEKVKVTMRAGLISTQLAQYSPTVALAGNAVTNDPDMVGGFANRELIDTTSEKKTIDIQYITMGDQKYAVYEVRNDVLDGNFINGIGLSHNFTEDEVHFFGVTFNGQPPVLGGSRASPLIPKRAWFMGSDGVRNEIKLSALKGFIKRMYTVPQGRSVDEAIDVQLNRLRRLKLDLTDKDAKALTNEFLSNADKIFPLHKIDNGRFAMYPQTCLSPRYTWTVFCDHFATLAANIQVTDRPPVSQPKDEKDAFEWWSEFRDSNPGLCNILSTINKDKPRVTMNLPVLYDLCQLCSVLKGIDFTAMKDVIDGVKLIRSDLVFGCGKKDILSTVLQIILTMGPVANRSPLQEAENSSSYDLSGMTESGTNKDGLFGSGMRSATNQDELVSKSSLIEFGGEEYPKYDVDGFVDWMTERNMMPPFGVAFLYNKQYVTDSMVVASLAATKFAQLAPVTTQMGMFRESVESIIIQTKQRCPCCYNGLGPSSMLVPNTCVTRVPNSHNFKLCRPECYAGAEPINFNAKSEFRKPKMYPIPCDVVLCTEAVDRGWSPTGRNMGAFENYIDALKPNEKPDPIRNVSSFNWCGTSLLNPIVLLYESCLSKDASFILDKYLYGNSAALRFGEMVYGLARLMSPDKGFDTKVSDAKKNQGKSTPIEEEPADEGGFYLKNAVKNDSFSDITMLAMPGNTWNDEGMENEYSLKAGRLFSQGEPGVIKGNNDNKWFMPGNMVLGRYSSSASWSETMRPPLDRNTQLRTVN